MGATTAAVVSAVDSAWTMGVKRVLVVRVNFPDDLAEPATQEETLGLMNAANVFYLENSYGQLSLTSDVTPVLTLPQSVEYYNSHPSRQFALRDDALAAARAAGFDSDLYDLDVVMNRRLFGYRATVNGRGCWLQGADIDKSIHELGHNVGLGHANLWIGRGDTIIGPGRMLPYGNLYDVMGDIVPGSWPNRHFNAAHKYKLGWVTDSHVVSIATGGVYRVHALDTSALEPGAPVALKLAGVAGREYWMECRQKCAANAWAQNGLFLYFGPWAESYGVSPLLDTTPNSHWADDSKDAPLVVGRTFSDLEAGIHITALSRGESTSAWMDVRVVLGFFPSNQTPAVTLESGSVEVMPGEPVVFEASGSDPDGDEMALSWDFGDGTLAGNSNVVSKAWTVPGVYLVRCWVSDMKGGSDFASRAVRVGNAAGGRVSGRVTCQGLPVAGARISVTESLVTYTDVQGRYTAVGLPAGSYQLHPGKAWHTFDPPSRVVLMAGEELTGQDFEAVWTDAPNNPPYVTTWSPVPETLMGTPATIPLQAWAYDDGEVQMVQFELGTGLASMGIGNSYFEVWTNVWTGVPAGSYEILAQALDDFGAVGQAMPARVTVLESPTRLVAPSLGADGLIQLKLSGPSDRPWAIEASGDLVEWMEIGQVTNHTGEATWVDPLSRTVTKRFYRLRQL